MKKTTIYIVYLLFILYLVGCSTGDSSDNHPASITEQNHKEIEGNFLASIQPVETSISIASVGDLLIHSRVYDDAEQADGSYNFLPMFEEVQAYLKEPTITMANQETIMGGKEIGLSTYPQFNSPFELGDNLKELGVDIVTMANNHTLDRGEIAIQNAIGYYDKIGMLYTGSFKDEEDQKQIRVIEEEGIRVSFLSYTYGTNGIPVPEGKDYLVNLIDKELMEREIKEAEQLSDIIVVSLHFGNEYERLPNNEQRSLAQFVADLGVDVVIGHHPHVLQPVDWVEGKEGNQMLIAYSLGNFLSGQDKLYRQIGGIFNFEVTKTTDRKGDTFEVHSPSMLPTFVHHERINGKMRNYSIIPMKDISNQHLNDAKGHYEEIKNHLSQFTDIDFME